MSKSIYGGDQGIVSVTSFTDLLKTYSSKIDTTNLEKSYTLMRMAAKGERVAPKESDFLYIRDRAVSAGNVIVHDNGCEVVPLDTMYADFAHYSPIIRGCNTNGDFWSVDELKETGKTFIGKSVFVDHNNASVEQARGIILDAHYNDKWHYVELLEAIDAAAFPQLATSIRKRYVTGTSMGCYATSARCSICGHICSIEDDSICEHVERYKGGMLNGLRVFEENRGCEFFENSIVVNPADTEARILQIVANKHTNSHKKVNMLSNTQRNAIHNEINQRTRAGRAASLGENLNNLPWS